MKYSIIFTICEQGELRSWLDGNNFESEQRAIELASEMCHNWWEQGENISFMVFRHIGNWETRYENL